MKEESLKLLIKEYMDYASKMSNDVTCLLKIEKNSLLFNSFATACYILKITNRHDGSHLIRVYFYITDGTLTEVSISTYLATYEGGVNRHAIDNMDMLEVIKIKLTILNKKITLINRGNRGLFYV